MRKINFLKQDFAATDFCMFVVLLSTLLIEHQILQKGSRRNKLQALCGGNVRVKITV